MTEIGYSHSLKHSLVVRKGEQNGRHGQTAKHSDSQS